MSNTRRGPTSVRPSWDYKDGLPQHNVLEITESVRNVLEDIQRSQMLQCDVAHAIKDIAKTLRRIDRRMAKKQ